MADWSMPALYFLRGSRSPSPPPLPSHQQSASAPGSATSVPTAAITTAPPYSSLAPAAPRRDTNTVLQSSPSSTFSCIAALSPVPISCTFSSSLSRPSPPLSQPVALRPLCSSGALSAESWKKAKRKASVTHAIDDTALRHVHLSTSPILTPLLSAAAAAASAPLSSASPSLSYPFPPLDPATLSLPISTLHASVWAGPPPFLAPMLLRFFDGRTLAACLRVSSALRRDLLAHHRSPPLNVADDCAVAPSAHSSAGAGLVCISQDTQHASDAAAFHSLSFSATTLLRSVYSSDVAHTMHTLKISTARLTKQTCQLLSSLLFLRHLELRLFEHLADEWRTDFLSSAGPGYGADLFFLPSSSMLSTHSAYSVNDLPAIAASAAALRAALRRMASLQCVSVVGFVDVEDSDDLPVSSALSSAILDAMADLRVKRLELRDGHFARPHGYSSVLSERRLHAMAELESVHVIDAAQWDATQLQVLLACPQLVDVRVIGEHFTTSAQLQAMAAAWPALQSLRLESVAVAHAQPAGCRQVEEAQALLNRCCLLPALDTTEHECEVEFDSSLCVTSQLSPLLSLSRLTSLHLTFIAASLTAQHLISLALCSPNSALPLLSPSSTSSSLSSSALGFAEQQPPSFCVDAAVWDSLWLPSSPLVRQLRHLSLPVLAGARMSAVFDCVQLCSLRLVGPLSVDAELLAALLAGRAAACGTLRDLSLPCAVSQLSAVSEWLDATHYVVGNETRLFWPLLRRVQIAQAGVGVEREASVLLDKLVR